MVPLDATASPLSLTEIDRLIADEERLDDEVLHLTANEAVLSPRAHRAMSSKLANRYLLEHLDMRQPSPSRLGNLLYRGLDGVNEIERSAARVCRLMFGAEFAEFRCVSGLHAMQTTFAALTRPGDKIMRVSTHDGGHFLTELICRSFGRLSCTYVFKGIGELDLERTRETFQRERPVLLYIDAMNYLFPLPLKELRRVTGDTPIVFDASHTLGLIAGGQFPNPLQEGADVLQANTHKTFFGPQKGIILGNDRALMERIGYVLSNGLVSSQHTASTLALFVALHEMYGEGERYATDVVRTARRLARAIHGQGVPVLAADRGFTDNHMFFVDARPFGSGLLVLDRLLRANISANRLLPYPHVDAIRLGVQEVTRRGYTDADLEVIAGWFRRLLVDGEDPAAIRREVVGLVRGRTGVYYCGEPATGARSRPVVGPTGDRAQARAQSPAAPRWTNVSLLPATGPVDGEVLAQARELGSLAGAFEHQVDSAGNIGICSNGRLYVTASGAHIKKLRDDDLVEVLDFTDWTLRCRGSGPPSTEAYLHYLLQQRLGADFIVHNHYIPDRRLESMDIAVIAPCEYGSVELAQAAAEIAQDHQVFYVRRHGLVFWATSFDECRQHLARVARGMALLEGVSAVDRPEGEC